MEICKRELCTGCGACAFVCPKKCIAMAENSTGIIYPEINSKECVSCGACKKICPQVNRISLYDIKEAYAAWSCDSETRRTSASGGIAAEIYRLACEKNHYCAGAVINEDFSVSMEVTESLEKIELFKNSKYVFSSAYNLFEKLKKCVKREEQVVVIGLPCQIAAIRKLFGNYEKFLLVDVVCHGTTPTSYLQQHIKRIEKESSDKATKLFFRDPNRGTNTYTFAVYNQQDECFYRKRLADGDSYQYGYHRWISYRDNCYQCQYAQPKRCSDITIGDYKGLGKKTPCTYDECKVSCVLVHTEKGKQWIEELISKKRIVADARPIEEPINGDSQLRNPTPKISGRYRFEREIKKKAGDFEAAMEVVMKCDRRRNMWQKILSSIKKMKRLILK